MRWVVVPFYGMIAEITLIMTHVSSAGLCNAAELLMRFSCVIIELDLGHADNQA